MGTWRKPEWLDQGKQRKSRGFFLLEVPKRSTAYSEIDLPGQEPFLTTKWRELVAPFIPKHALAG